MAVKLETTALAAGVLAAFELFRDLPSEAIAALSRRCQCRRYHSHQIILGYRDDSRDVFFVVRGQVRVTFFLSAAARCRSASSPPEKYSAESPPSTVVALTDTMVAVMSASLFWDLLRAHQPVNAYILRRLTRLVRALSERVVEFSTLTVRKRILVELLRLARETAPGDKCAVIFPAPTHARVSEPSEHSSGSRHLWPGRARARRHRREAGRHARRPRC
jgi:CRP/FNR family transcriptional regulator, cyclic AMP receptor protein